VQCWREGEDAPAGQPHWRISVEEILRERRQRGLADLASMLAYLQVELSDDGERSSDLP
jgi:hypothetical protein